MVKRLQKTFLVLILCIWCILSVGNTAYAEVKESTLFMVTQPQDIVVTITYEVDDISFTLISPSGQMITKETDEENITVFPGTTATLIFLGQAEMGEWKIQYDKGSNESIHISADIQDTSFFISEYQPGKLIEEKIPVSFTVSADQDIYYYYKLVLTTDTESLNGKELVNGGARTGENVTKEIELKDVNTYEEYYLMLYVYYDLNGAEIFDYSYSEPFAYTNKQMPEAMENIDILVLQDSKIIEADWRNYRISGADSYYVSAYVGEECILSQEYPVDNGYVARIPFEEGDKVRLEINYKNRNGVISQNLIKEIDTSAVILTLPESGKVSSDIWSFAYKGAKNTEVTFSVNGAKSVVVLDGEGSKYITLPELRNDIVVTYQDAEGYVYKYQRTANISNVLPTIELLRQIDGVTTEQAMIMVSGTTNAEMLTLNGQEIEVKEGNFSYQFGLSDGSNDIVLEATIGDNVTRLNATVIKEIPKTVAVWIYLCAGLAVSVVGILLVAILTGLRSRRKAKGKKGQSLLAIIMSWLFAVLVWLAWFFLNRFENSAAYLELAYESLEKADKLLLLTKISMWVAMALSGVAVLRTVIFIMAKKLRKKKEESVNEEVKRDRKKIRNRKTKNTDTTDS